MLTASEFLMKNVLAPLRMAERRFMPASCSDNSGNSYSYFGRDAQLNNHDYYNKNDGDNEQNGFGNSGITSNKGTGDVVLHDVMWACKTAIAALEEIRKTIEDDEESSIIVPLAGANVFDQLNDIGFFSRYYYRNYRNNSSHVSRSDRSEVGYASVVSGNDDEEAFLCESNHGYDLECESEEGDMELYDDDEECERGGGMKEEEGREGNGEMERQIERGRTLEEREEDNESEEDDVDKRRITRIALRNIIVRNLNSRFKNKQRKAPKPSEQDFVSPGQVEENPSPNYPKVGMKLLSNYNPYSQSGGGRGSIVKEGGGKKR